MTINQIIEEIAYEKKWHILIDKIIYPNTHYRNAVISEIGYYFLTNEKAGNKLKEVYKCQNQFKYYLSIVIRNQVHSNRSSFYKNNIEVRREINGSTWYNTTAEDNDYQLVNLESTYEDDLEEATEEKLILEYKYNLIDKYLKNIKHSWFNMQMFNEYYSTEQSIREMGKKYDINYNYIYNAINKVRTDLLAAIEKDNGK